MSDGHQTFTLVAAAGWPTIAAIGSAASEFVAAGERKQPGYGAYYSSESCSLRQPPQSRT